LRNLEKTSESKALNLKNTNISFGVIGFQFCFFN